MITYGSIALIVITALTGCQGSDSSRISKDEAAAALREQGYTDPILGPAPDGWTGTALTGGYTVQVTVDKRGLIQVTPP